MKPQGLVGLMSMGMLMYFIQDAAAQCEQSVFDAEEAKGKILVNHVRETIFTSSDSICRIQCHLHHDCVSYNLGPSSTSGMMVCQLNDADRYQYPQHYQDRPGYSYRGRKNACVSGPCPRNATCQLTGFEEGQYKCVCRSGFTGQHCDKERGVWLKLNNVQVCTGAKDDSFGTVTIPFTGKVRRLKLVHLSGGVSWSGGLKWAGKWGDTLRATHLEIHITDINNTRVAPSSDYPGLDPSGRRFTIDNITVMSPELIYPEFVPRYPLRKGATLRTWYGDDLYNYLELDNYGETCADLYGMF